MTPTVRTEHCDLYLADCRDVLPSLSGVDAVVTDPPYGVDLTAKRAKMRGGGMTIRQGTYTHEDTPEYVRTVVVPAIEVCRKIASCVVLTPGVRNLWAYPPSEDVGGFFSAAGTGCSRWGFTCLQPILYYGKDPYLMKGMGSRANSTGQTYPNDANEYDHPCAKPIRMMLWLVSRASMPGDTILDPFAGSGTTAVACIRTGRRCIAIEKDAKYFDIMVRRVQKAEGVGSLFDPTRAPEPADLFAEAV